ncbi:MAG TPA: hypothetical protein P5110_06885 [Candidatus Omnitrophota bacterium]|nr:hypothetical protein [Candidatus Omnitrophota bacterium]
MSLFETRSNIQKLIKAGAPRAAIDRYLTLSGYALEELRGDIPVLETPQTAQVTGVEAPIRPLPIGTTFTGENAEKKGFDPFTAFGKFEERHPMAIPLAITNPVFLGVSELLSKIPRLSQTKAGKAILSNVPEEGEARVRTGAPQYPWLPMTPEAPNARVKTHPQESAKQFLDALQTIGEFYVAGKADTAASQVLLKDAVERVGGKFVAAKMEAGYAPSQAVQDIKIQIPPEVIEKVGEYTPSGRAILANIESRFLRIKAKPGLAGLKGGETSAELLGFDPSLGPDVTPRLTGPETFTQRDLTPFEKSFNMGDLRTKIEQEVVKSYYATKGLAAGENFVTSPVRTDPNQLLPPWSGKPQTPEEWAAEKARYEEWLASREGLSRPELNVPFHPAPQVPQEPITPQGIAEDKEYQAWLASREPTQRPELNVPLHPAPEGETTGAPIPATVPVVPEAPKKTNISVKEFRKLNPWVKTDAQAEKIINDVNTKPSVSLDEIVAKKQASKEISVKLPTGEKVPAGKSNEIMGQRWARETGVAPALPIPTPVSPVQVFNESKQIIPVEGRPEIYTDGRLLLLDRTPEEVKKWTEKKKVMGGSISHEAVIKAVPQPVQPLPEPAFVKHIEGADVAVIPVGTQQIYIEAKALSWLQRQGYSLSFDPKAFDKEGQYKQAITLIRDNKIAGAISANRQPVGDVKKKLLEDLSEAQKSGKLQIDYSGEEWKPGRGSSGPREPGEPRNLLPKQEKKLLLEKIDEAITLAPEDAAMGELKKMPPMVDIQIGGWKLKIPNNKVNLKKFRDIVNRRGSLDVRFLEPMADAIGKYFIRGGNINPRLFRIHQSQLARQSADMFDHMLTVRDLGKAMDKYPKQITDLALEVMKHKQAIELLPQELQPLISKARKDIDRLSMMILKYGSISQKMQDTIYDNLGRYMSRRYAIFEDKNYNPTDQQIQVAVDFFKADPEYAGLDETQIRGLVDSLVYAKKNGFGNLHRGGKMKRVSQAHFLHRKDIPKEIRDLYGESEDLEYLYLSTVADLSVIAHTSQALQEIAAEFTFPTPFPGCVRIPDGRAYGALAGKYVEKETAEFIDQMIDPKKNIFLPLVDALITQPFKWAHTVGNIPTHPRNLAGNFAFDIFSKSSVFNPQHWWACKQAVKVWMGRHGEHRETWKNLIGQGIIETEFTNSELEGHLQALIDRGDKFGWGMALWDAFLTNPITKSLGDLYNFEDQFFKIKTFLVATQKWGWTPKQAAAFIDESYPNYRDVPEATKFLRNVPILGRFISFNSEALRILVSKSARAFGQPLSGVRGGSGEYEIPYTPSDSVYLGIAIPLLVFGPYIARMALAKAHDIDLQEMDKLTAISSPYRRNAMMVYYRDQEGKIKGFDAAYLLPWGVYQQAFSGTVRGDFSWLNNVFFADPTLDMIDMLKTGKDQYGRMITNELYDWYVNLAKLSWEVGTRLYGPSFWGVSNIIAAKQGSIDRYGRSRNMGEEIKAFLTGIRTFTIYPEDIQERYFKKLDAQMQEITRATDEWIDSHPNASQAEIDKKYDEEDRAFRNYERKDAEAMSVDFKKLGPPPK